MERTGQSEARTDQEDMKSEDGDKVQTSGEKHRQGEGARSVGTRGTSGSESSVK